MYTRTIDIELGAGYAGLTLKAKLFGLDGVAVGGFVTSGFVEIGGGDYQWFFDAFPDDFEGSVRIYKSDGTYMAFAGVSPLTDVEAQLQLILSACQQFNPSSVVTTSAVTNSGRSVTTYRGDSYTVGSPRGPMDWPLPESDTTDLTGATVVFTSRNKASGVVELSVAGSVLSPTGPAKTIRVQLTAAQTALLTPGSSAHGCNPHNSNKFDVQVTLADGVTKWTPVAGGAPGMSGGHTIIENQTPIPGPG